MARSKTKTWIVATIMIASFAGGAYYFKEREANASAPEAAAPQAMPVNVKVVAPEPVQIWNDYSARLEAVDFAEIRPQVSGKITELRFQDGQDVEEGDILYVIDPRPYKAAVNQAKAELDAAENQSALSWKELSRALELIKTNAISKRILDERASAHDIAEAAVKAAKARLDRAKIDLDYAYVKEPITGRVSRAEIKIGNLVEAGPAAPLLTSIVSTEGIYADFEVDEQTYLKYIRQNARNREAENKIPVKLKLGSDDLAYEGFIDSFDNQIDPTSGTIRARALFENEDGALLPGMFASVQLGTPDMRDTILLDERAIGTDQDRKFVYIVNDQNMSEYREVKIGESIEGARIIRAGLSNGDRVITEGIIRLRPGMPVAPQIQPSESPAQAKSILEAQEAQQ